MSLLLALLLLIMWVYNGLLIARIISTAKAVRASESALKSRY